MAAGWKLPVLDGFTPRGYLGRVLNVRVFWSSDVRLYICEGAARAAILGSSWWCLSHFVPVRVG